jgi:hypothetical protein
MERPYFLLMVTAGCAVGQKAPGVDPAPDAGAKGGRDAAADAGEAGTSDAGLDAGTADAAGPGCDPIAQDCGAGEACYVLDVDLASGGIDAACLAAGKGVQGAGCGEHGDCARGYQCSEGVCAQFCEPDGELGCPVGSRCEGLGTGVGLCA